MPWYQGYTLLYAIEHIHIKSDTNLIDLRFPIQYITRINKNLRGYSGTLSSGIIRTHDKIKVLPSGCESSIKEIITYKGKLDEAFAHMPITLILSDNIDISRGDMIVHSNNIPYVQNYFEAMLVWMVKEPMVIGKEYLLKHSTKNTLVCITNLRYIIDINSLRKTKETSMSLNRIGRFRLETHEPLCYDSYSKNRSTGAFILIDKYSYETVATGTIVDRLIENKKIQNSSKKISSPNTPLTILIHIQSDTINKNMIIHKLKKYFLKKR